MTDTKPLVERESYQLGRQDVKNGLGDFRRRSFFGDERRAYMLGRSHEIAKRAKEAKAT